MQRPTSGDAEAVALARYVLGDPVNRIDPSGLAATDCSDFVDALVGMAQSKNTSNIGPNTAQAHAVGTEMVRRYIPSDDAVSKAVRFALDAPLAKDPSYQRPQGFSGFRCDLTQGGQDAGVYRHVAGAAAAVLQYKGPLVNLQDMHNNYQASRDSSTVQQRFAENQGNEAGRPVGRDIREFLNDRISTNELRGRLNAILCGGNCGM